MSKLISFSIDIRKYWNVLLSINVGNNNMLIFQFLSRIIKLKSTHVQKQQYNMINIMQKYGLWNVLNAVLHEERRMRSLIKSITLCIFI